MNARPHCHISAQCLAWAETQGNMDELDACRDQLVRQEFGRVMEKDRADIVLRALESITPDTQDRIALISESDDLVELGRILNLHIDRMKWQVAGERVDARKGGSKL